MGGAAGPPACEELGFASISCYRRRCEGEQRGEDALCVVSGCLLPIARPKDATLDVQFYPLPFLALLNRSTLRYPAGHLKLATGVMLTHW